MFHEIKELSKDKDDYIYWKGSQCEHFSHEALTDPKYAQELAEKCRFVESLGIEVDGGSVVWRWHHVKDFTVGSQYQHLLRNHYNILEKEGRCAIIASDNCYEDVDGIWKITHQEKEIYQFHRELQKLGYKTPVLDQPKSSSCPNGIETANQASYHRLVEYFNSNQVPENLLVQV
jgi:hypothetical protein